MKIKRLRRLKEVQNHLLNSYNIDISLYKLRKLAIDNCIPSYKNGNTFYLYLDDAVSYIKEESNEGV